MNKSDVIKYLGSVLNIDTEDSMIFDEMIEDLKRLKEFTGYKDFIKSNFNHEKYKYLNGYQKFLVLTDDFKKGIVQITYKTVIEDKEKFIEKFISKIKGINNTITELAEKEEKFPAQIKYERKIETNYMNLKTKDGIALFNKKELELIKRLNCSFEYILTLDESQLARNLKVIIDA